MANITSLRNETQQILESILGKPSLQRRISFPVLEELAEDIKVASLAVKELKEPIYSIDDIRPQPIDKAYFIDGAVRTVYTGYNIVCKGIDVPIFISQIVAGASLREDRKLQPVISRSVFVIMVPSRALRENNCDIISPPSSKVLDYKGEFYEKLMKSKVLFTDTSVELRKKNEILSMSIKPEEIAGIGKIRRRALDRAKVIMRIMELMLAYEISRGSSEIPIVMDGPIGILLPYSRLIGGEAVNLNIDFTSELDPEQQSKIYDLLNRIVGVVKNVVRIPLNLHMDNKVHFYSFPHVSGLVGDEEEHINEDDIRSYILAGYTRLRPFILKEVPATWSPASALIRIDIPLPAILEDSLRDKWVSSFRERLRQADASPTQVISNYIKSSGYAQRKLKEIASHILGEAMPLPPGPPHRKLTELYPIYETELWIKSKILSPEELSQLIP